MTRAMVTVRLEEGMRAELDELARAQDRDRSYVIKEAIEAWLDLHRWQLARIRQGLGEAERGEFAEEDEVEETWASFAR